MNMIRFLGYAGLAALYSAVLVMIVYGFMVAAP